MGRGPLDELPAIEFSTRGHDRRFVRTRPFGRPTLLIRENRTERSRFRGRCAQRCPARSPYVTLARLRRQPLVTPNDPRIEHPSSHARKEDMERGSNLLPPLFAVLASRRNDARCTAGDIGRTCPVDALFQGASTFEDLHNDIEPRSSMPSSSPGCFLSEEFLLLGAFYPQVENNLWMNGWTLLALGTSTGQKRSFRRGLWGGS